MIDNRCRNSRRQSLKAAKTKRGNPRSGSNGAIILPQTTKVPTTPPAFDNVSSWTGRSLISVLRYIISKVVIIWSLFRCRRRPIAPIAAWILFLFPIIRFDDRFGLTDFRRCRGRRRRLLLHSLCCVTLFMKSSRHFRHPSILPRGMGEVHQPVWTRYDQGKVLQNGFQPRLL